MAGFSTSLLRGIRKCPDLRFVVEKGSVHPGVPLQQLITRAESSSTSNWGTGEPTDDGTPSERGVEQSGSVTYADKPAGRHHDISPGRHQDESATSGFDVGEGPADDKKKGEQPKKSRTGSDMTDDGQVYTPNLERIRSTKDLFSTQSKDKKGESED